LNGGVAGKGEGATVVAEGPGRAHDSDVFFGGYTGEGVPIFTLLYEFDISATWFWPCGQMHSPGREHDVQEGFWYSYVEKQ